MQFQTYGLTMANFQSMTPDECFNLCREDETILLVHAYISKLAKFTKQVRIAHNGALSMQANTSLSINARVILMAFVSATHPTHTLNNADFHFVEFQTAATNFVSKVDEITEALTRVAAEEFITYDVAKDFTNLLNTFALLFSQYIDRERVRAQAALGNIVQGLVNVVNDAEAPEE